MNTRVCKCNSATTGQLRPVVGPLGRDFPEVSSSIPGSNLVRHPILWTCGFGRLLAVAALGFVAGCEFDDFLYDPSQVVTHNPTPVILPILTTLDLIDEPSPRLLGLSKVQAEDLIPEVRVYVLGPGDVVDISIFELVFTDQESGYRRIIDELGTIRLPHGIGTVSAGGRTARQLEQDIAEILLEKGIMIAEPVGTVVSQTKNSEVFKIIGDPYQGTTRFGLYQITRAEFPAPRRGGPCRRYPGAGPYTADLSHRPPDRRSCRRAARRVSRRGDHARGPWQRAGGVDP